jgi:hypothetical protein
MWVSWLWPFGKRRRTAGPVCGSLTDAPRVTATIRDVLIVAPACAVELGATSRNLALSAAIVEAPRVIARAKSVCC